MPKLIFLLPVYNSEDYIKECVDSILNQTFFDFSLIIVDDASTDRSLEILSNYTDRRINLYSQQKNTGYARILSNYSQNLDCEYFARMDSDDVCMPNRLISQTQAMDSCKKIAIMGSWILKINERRKQIGRCRYPTDHKSIKRLLLIGENPLCHPSILIRYSYIKSELMNYEPKMQPTEDYHLYLQAISQEAKIINYPDFLLSYRVHKSNISKLKRGLQLENVLHSLTSAIRDKPILCKCISKDWSNYVLGKSFSKNFLLYQNSSASISSIKKLTEIQMNRKELSFEERYYLIYQILKKRLLKEMLWPSSSGSFSISLLVYLLMSWKIILGIAWGKIESRMKSYSYKLELFIKRYIGVTT